MFHRIGTLLPALATFLCLMSGMGPAGASVVLSGPNQTGVLSGTFSRDDDVRLYDLKIGGGTPLPLVIETFSYAGGVLRDGALVPRGGFDPVLALFDIGGALLRLGADDPAKPDIEGDRNAYDDRLKVTLAPGRYFLSISQHRNEPPALLDFLAPGYGFSEAGWGDYTAWDCRGPSAAPFCDVQGAQRTGAYAIQLATVPLPGGLALMIGALLAGAALRRGIR